jgi:hypothetical protein
MPPHLTPNAWVIEQFGCARIDICRRDYGIALVTVDPFAEAAMWGRNARDQSAPRR